MDTGVARLGRVLPVSQAGLGTHAVAFARADHVGRLALHELGEALAAEGADDLAAAADAGGRVSAAGPGSSEARVRHGVAFQERRLLASPDFGLACCARMNEAGLACATGWGPNPSRGHGRAPKGARCAGHKERAVTAL